MTHTLVNPTKRLWVGVIKEKQLHFSFHISQTEAAGRKTSKSQHSNLEFLLFSTLLPLNIQIRDARQIKWSSFYTSSSLTLILSSYPWIRTPRNEWQILSIVFHACLLTHVGSSFCLLNQLCYLSSAWEKRLKKSLPKEKGWLTKIYFHGQQKVFKPD